MNSQDFIRLYGLLSKLETVNNRACSTDCSFRKYNSNSLDYLQGLKDHIRKIEQGLTTAKMIHPKPKPNSHAPNLAPRPQEDAQVLRLRRRRS